VSLPENDFSCSSNLGRREQNTKIKAEGGFESSTLVGILYAVKKRSTLSGNESTALMGKTRTLNMTKGMVSSDRILIGEFHGLSFRR